MTPAQLATFKVAIMASLDAGVIANRTPEGDHGVIAAYYNGLENAGTERVWKPSISVVELNKAVVWADFVTRTLQQQGVYMAMIAPGFIDATDAEIRNGFVAALGAGSTSLTNLTNIARRDSTRLERLFGGAASGGARVSSMFGAQATPSNVAQAIGLV